jgi:peptide/nickel transport system substrate-binding protein
MITKLTARMRLGGMALAFASMAGLAAADPTYGIAMIGSPALPPDFVSLPHVNPDAPKGGRIVFGESGTFDTLNPFNAAGQSATGISSLTVETLMGRSYDEPFTLYGLLAESIDTDADRTYVAFTLREEARFSDGSPVTVEDVLWSFETLGTVGNPRYAAAWKKIATAEATGPRTVRFTFNTVDRELPLILGLRPILKKAQWEGRDFTVTSLDAPIGSGPYVVAEFEAGRFISFRKNPDWWGKDLPFNRGQHNLDEVRYEYFGASAAVFEAFKAGELTSYREGNAAKWLTNYDFPAVTAGDVVKSEIPHSRPSGIEGFAMNTRRALFADWRVREALITAFNFELINTTITGGTQKRITSYYANSSLGMTPGTPAEGAVLAALEPFKAELLPGALEGYTLPEGDGTEANRANLRRAAALMEEAGWTVAEDGLLKNAAGEPFAFEILLVQGADEMASIASIYVESLKRLGIDARVTIVDSAQMKERTSAYDFDMTHYIRSVSLSPGNEQTLYWGSGGVIEPGTRNWMGVNSPAVDAMIAKMVAAGTQEELQVATQALDRLLISGRYVVPMWYSPASRLAHAKTLRFPDRLPLYGDWIGFQPDVWWYQE